MEHNGIISILRGENMATTVNNAFEEFIRDKVNLDSDKTKTARKSRDNLIDNIHSLGSNEDFSIYIMTLILHLVHLLEKQKLDL